MINKKIYLEWWSLDLLILHVTSRHMINQAKPSQAQACQRKPHTRQTTTIHVPSFYLNATPRPRSVTTPAMSTAPIHPNQSRPWARPAATLLPRLRKTDIYPRAWTRRHLFQLNIQV